MADPQYTRGSGGDPTNPPAQQGEAKAVNDLAAQDPLPQEAQQPQDQGSAPAGAPIPGIDGKPAPPIPTPAMGDDRSRFLFAPSDRPNEHVTAGLTQSGQLTQPPDLMDWLPDLQDLAADPTAPPMTKLLFQSITAAMGQ